MRKGTYIHRKKQRTIYAYKVFMIFCWGTNQALYTYLRNFPKCVKPS